MSGSLWRAILWIERFLPSPKPIASEAERIKKTQRLAPWFPFVAILPAVMPMLVHQRHELGVIVAQNRVAFAQLVLVFMACSVVAVIVAAGVFGARAWRDAKGAY